MTSKKVAATANKEQHTLHYCTICSYSYEELPTPNTAFKYKSNNDGTCSIVSLTDNTVKNLVIPKKSPSGDTVVSIEGEAFKKNKSIVSVTIPDTVSSIGYSAFEGCSNLKTVDFPKNTKENLKFYYRSFAFIAIEELDLTQTKIESIGLTSFYGCKKLKKVILNDVKTIEDFAFSQCTELESVIHSGELTKIGERAFQTCKKLTVFKGKNSKHNLDTIIYFSRLSFSESGIRDIVFNKDVKTIGDAFEGCANLGTVDYSQTDHTFGGFPQSYIEKIILPKSLTYVGSYSFYKTRMDSLVLPDTVTEIANDAFNHANIKKLTFGSGLTSIGARAFMDATIGYDFSKVTKPLTIGSEAFANNTFTSFSFPKSTVSIDEAALKGCDNLSFLSIPFIAQNNKPSTSISTDCFGWLFGKEVHCFEQEETVPSSLKTIAIHGENPSTRDFMNLMIENLVVGKEITYIGHENFELLKNIYYEGTSAEWSQVKIMSFGNQQLLAADVYFYSETKPTTSGKFWHYSQSGEVVVW